MANGNIHFYGKAYKDDFQIFLSVTFRRGHRLRYYTGIRVPNEFWDTQKQCVKSARKYPQSAETNSYLRNLANEASRIIVSFQNQKEFLTDKKLKEKLDAFRNKKSDGEDPITFISFFERQIKERKGNPSRYSNSSIKVYQTTFNKILEFAKDKKRSIDFADFDHSFFESFTNYLFDRKFQPNYVHKITSNLQTFLKEAFLREISSELKYKENWLKVSRQSVESIYLNEEELDQIYHLKFPKKEEHLERARDLFLIGCYTGLRYSDFSHLKAANIHILKGVKVLKVLTQKTGQQVTIPLKTVILDILQKYNGIPPKSVSNQKTNEYLKEIGQKAGLTQEVIKHTYKGGTHREEYVPKFAMISTHTARRSFASNAYSAGIPTKSIMEITGHKTEREFFKYIKLSSDEHALLMADNPFFK